MLWCTAQICLSNRLLITPPSNSVGSWRLTAESLSGNGDTEGSCLTQDHTPFPEEWRENLYPMTDGSRAHRSRALALIWDSSKGSYIPAMSIESAEPSATIVEHVNSSLCPVNLLPSFHPGVRCLTWKHYSQLVSQGTWRKINIQNSKQSTTLNIFLKPPNIYCSLSLSYPVSGYN